MKSGMARMVHYEGFDLDPTPFAQLPDDIPERSTQLASENLETVFRTPYNMVFTFPYGLC